MKFVLVIESLAAGEQTDLLQLRGTVHSTPAVVHNFHAKLSRVFRCDLISDVLQRNVLCRRIHSRLDPNIASFDFVFVYHFLFNHACATNEILCLEEHISLVSVPN
jgi:hypothetical protein